MKIAIIGSQGKHWTPAQRTKVIQKIKDILIDPIHIDYPLSPMDPNFDPGDIVFPTLVSGGCGATGEDKEFYLNPGVDGWAEIVADFIGLEKVIYYPIYKQWKPFGYRDRNIKIAEECDILYCIDPADRGWSGGRWTMNKAKELGKEVHLVLIE